MYKTGDPTTKVLRDEEGGPLQGGGEPRLSHPLPKWRIRNWDGVRPPSFFCSQISEEPNFGPHIIINPPTSPASPAFIRIPCLDPPFLPHAPRPVPSARTVLRCGKGVGGQGRPHPHGLPDPHAAPRPQRPRPAPPPPCPIPACSRPPPPKEPCWNQELIVPGFLPCL